MAHKILNDFQKDLSGQTLNGRFLIDSKIGEGGFGQVYLALDEKKKISVAVKVVPVKKDRGRAYIEQQLIDLLQGNRHVPKLIETGYFDGFMFIIMEMLGKNLGELRRQRTNKRLSISTVLRIGQQAIEGLKNVHQIGFIHRDIKPGNMCIGLEGQNRRTIFIIDFGMIRSFKNRKKREHAGFRGTMRYVSLTVHDRKEQGPVDDLWSIFYTLIELAEGSLPWNGMRKESEVAPKKRSFKFEEFCKYVPKSVKDFQSHLEKLQYHQIPNYPLLTKILQNALPLEVSNDSLYDWEEDEIIINQIFSSKKLSK